ncbi:hypothetical protein LSCM4_06128 [Leishmania orientalis]|uniref:Uncharacterized protein n=1 Tax=Leishmania orientalis TaxID=2249476 RepID=A0A836H6C9_9TRYP|nr:hypothetical protein LSCM4_06128 [Leishmania orientalis]
MSTFPTPTPSTAGRAGTKEECAAVAAPQCVCATCMMRLPMPRPSSVFTSFQCPQCRMNGMDAKLVYTCRAQPTEHSTR